MEDSKEKETKKEESKESKISTAAITGEAHGATYSVGGVWIIVISIIILIIVGILVYFKLSPDQVLSWTTIALYILGIILLVIGLLWLIYF